MPTITPIESATLHVQNMGLHVETRRQEVAAQYRVAVERVEAVVSVASNGTVDFVFAIFHFRVH